jgi:hypothetical protein
LLARDLGPASSGAAEGLLAERAALLAERRRARPPRAAARARAHRLRWVDAQITLVVAALARRQMQRAESLRYLNDRPFTLPLYLTFGADFLCELIARAEFAVEQIEWSGESDRAS